MNSAYTRNAAQQSSRCLERQESLPSQRPKPGSFRLKNVVINDGEFVARKTVHVTSHNSPSDISKSFERLQKLVSPSAFHDSAQRVDPPRCHPATRIMILQTIFDWIIQSGHQQSERILWLNGAAGAGKSAIMQSIAERCALAGIAVVSFFLSRSDSSRNTMASLVPTLVYQLLQRIPETANGILETIKKNPLIFDLGLEFQFQELIFRPLYLLPPDLQQLFVIFIDGLDECIELSHQSNLIKTISKVLSNANIPVKFLIASRRESQIEASFGQKDVINLLRIVPLDKIQASDDIRRYIQARFDDIKKTHLRKAYLPASWPQPGDIEEIVAKASGQFIYASVVMNYVSSHSAHPVVQLDVIKGIRLRRPSSENPFAHLDALYEHIFSRVEDLDLVRNILAMTLIDLRDWPCSRDITVLEALFGLHPGELETLFTSLTAVIQCDTPSSNYYSSNQPWGNCIYGSMKIVFLHASLPDFLLDKTRSDRYFIDLTEYRTSLLYGFLQMPGRKMLSPTDQWNVVLDGSWRLNAIASLLENAKASEQLRSAFMDFVLVFHDNDFVNAQRRVGILSSLKMLNFGDQGEAYRHVLNMFAKGYAKFWPHFDEYVVATVKAYPDLLAYVNHLHGELNSLQES
ncbi:hypothetical protein BDN70DRAFT_925383 [Pholiota conissans]|uniref:Nephrocystin 3-like N-terminal domain-containing protein n=1 Tax=Pholiota conissans TaxID=109636 RepID=A0A9P5YPE2_9AGAR|nr:hypothetical protein BDN70DRAFT_925383 [Pholiota conissans]